MDNKNPNSFRRDRQELKAKFRQPPPVPVIDIDDNYGRRFTLSIEEATALHMQLGQALEEAAQKSELERK